MYIIFAGVHIPRGDSLYNGKVRKGGGVCSRARAEGVQAPPVPQDQGLCTAGTEPQEQRSVVWELLLVGRASIAVKLLTAAGQHKASE